MPETPRKIRLSSMLSDLSSPDGPVSQTCTKLLRVDILAVLDADKKIKRLDDKRIPPPVYSVAVRKVKVFF